MVEADLVIYIFRNLAGHGDPLIDERGHAWFCVVQNVWPSPVAFSPM